MISVELSELRKITPSDIQKLGDDAETLLVAIRIPELIKSRLASLFDAYELDNKGAEVTRDCLFAEWHRDTDKFVYWLDLDTDVRYVTDLFDCGYLNGLVADLG